MSGLKRFDVETMAPAPWVSWRTYHTERLDRTLVLNQQSSEFLLLEGSASNLWDLIAQQPCSVGGLCSRLGLSTQEVVDFCLELVAVGVLGSGQPDKRSNLTPTPTPTPKTGDDLENEMLIWTEQNGFIFAAHWEMTYRCNERCIHCYNPGAARGVADKPNRRKNELTTDEAKELLQQLADLGVFRLTLSGGEPTVRRDFLELLGFARRLGFQVIIYTNGLKLSTQLLEKISAKYPYTVEISIYSASAEQHDHVTQVPGSFAKSLRTLEHFRQQGTHTIFKTTLTRETIGDWKDTLALGASHAETAILNAMIAPGVDGNPAPLAAAANFDQLVVFASCPGSPLYVGGPDNDWGRDDLPDRSSRPCGAGHSSIAITPDGEIYPCIAFPMPIGNFRASGVGHLGRRSDRISDQTVNRSEFAPAEALEQWRAIKIKDLKECGTLERCHYCGDLCPGDAFVQTGDPLRAAANHCRQAEARRAASQYLRAGHSPATLCEKFGVDVDFGRVNHSYRPPSLSPTAGEGI